MSSLRHELCDKPNNTGEFLLEDMIKTFLSDAKLVQARNEDVQNTTSRNITETGINVASEMAGGIFGGWLGEYIGDQIKPGEGKKIGGIMGAMIGAYVASSTSDAIVSSVLDSNNYDMNEVECKLCQRIFNARIYKGEKLCKDCK